MAEEEPVPWPELKARARRGSDGMKNSEAAGTKYVSKLVGRRKKFATSLDAGAAQLAIVLSGSGRQPGSLLGGTASNESVGAGRKRPGFARMKVELRAKTKP